MVDLLCSLVRDLEEDAQPIPEVLEARQTDPRVTADDTGCPISPDEKASANLVHSAMR